MNEQSPIVDRSAAASACWLKSDYAGLPFFGEDHRLLAERVSRWLREREPEIAATLARSPYEAVRLLIRMLGEAGWFSVALKGAVDTRTLCLIREALACRHDLLDYAFSIQILAAMPLALWGDDRQRAEILPKLCSGESVGAFALTERESGTNISAVELQAEETGSGYLLNGQKHWIANADIADHVMVLARTGPAQGALGLSLFVVDTNSSFYSTEAVALIAPRPFAHISLDACPVPADCMIGGKGMGLAVAIDTLERCRITVGAAANGFARRALGEASDHVLKRRKSGKRLADIPAVRQALARIAMDTHAARLTVAHAAWEMDREGRGKGYLSSLAKLLATESAQVAIDRCVQLHGASGVVAGSVPESLYRQIRSLRIYEGASEVQEAILADAVVAGALR